MDTTKHPLLKYPYKLDVKQMKQRIQSSANYETKIRKFHRLYEGYALKLYYVSDVIRIAETMKSIPAYAFADFFKSLKTEEIIFSYAGMLRFLNCAGILKDGSYAYFANKQLVKVYKKK